MPTIRRTLAFALPLVGAGSIGFATGAAEFEGITLDGLASANGALEGERVTSTFPL